MHEHYAFKLSLYMRLVLTVLFVLTYNIKNVQATDPTVISSIDILSADPAGADNQFNLAGIFYYGDETDKYHKGGVARDYLMAFKWYERAAKQNHIDAMHMLGHMYHYGIGTKDNIPEAIRLYERAGRFGKGESYYALGQIYESYYSAPNKALKYYILAADRKHRDSMITVSRVYIERQRSKTDASLNKTNDAGRIDDKSDEVRALNDRATDASAPLDEVLMSDVEVAIENKGSIDIGSEDATGDISYMEIDGKNVESYLYILAQQDDADAIYLSAYLAEGVNMETAITWYHKAADLGQPNAQGRLGDLYISSIIPAQDDIEKVEKGVYWYTVASDNNDIESTLKLASIYTVDKRYTKAYQRLVMAKEMGSIEAMRELGYRYKHGVGVEVDYKVALNEYKSAALSGDIYSIFQLVKIYDEGSTVDNGRRFADADDKIFAYALCKVGVQKLEDNSEKILDKLNIEQKSGLNESRARCDEVLKYKPTFVEQRKVDVLINSL